MSERDPRWAPPLHQTPYFQLRCDLGNARITRSQNVTAPERISGVARTSARTQGLGTGRRGQLYPPPPPTPRPQLLSRGRSSEALAGRLGGRAEIQREEGQAGDR